MWVTTKDGRRVDTDWFDKERQIAQNQAEADSRTLEEKYSHINPNYKPDSKAWDPYHYNCVKCAFAFEANMRGDDTEANPRDFKSSDDTDRANQDIIAKAIGKKGDVWDVGSNKRELVIKRISDMMEDFGPNSRAFLFLYHKDGKHIVNVISKDGKISIVDAQSGKHGDLKTMLKYYITKTASIVRTDDAEIPDEWKKWAYKKR